MEEARYIAPCPGRWSIDSDGVNLDPTEGYNRWLGATGRAFSGEPFYGLARSFPSWSPPRAVARRVRASSGPGRYRPFEPLVAALGAAGCGQVPETAEAMVGFARARPSWFTSGEVAAGAAVAALDLARGEFVERGELSVVALVSRKNLRDPNVVAGAEEGELLEAHLWSFHVQHGLRGASLNVHPFHLACSEWGLPQPAVVVLPF